MEKSKDLEQLKKKGLKILHINIRSLVPKVEEVKIYTETMKPDFLCVSETWLTSDIDNFEVQIPGYKFIRKDRNIIGKSRGGGILIYFKEKYAYIANISTPDTSSDIISILFTQPNSKPLNIITGYRPEHDRLFQKNLNELLAKNTYEKILIGDFNYEIDRKNKDWEDITSVPVEDTRWLVVGDIGDNKAKRKSIKLYFTEEPRREDDDHYHGKLELKHWLELTYPDKPRDCESMAYDPIGKQILFLSKRDKPSHLYAVNLETALTQKSAELKFLGEIALLRPPTPANRAQFGGRTDFISQPTGFDISADGSEAVIITYRSLYRFQREQDEDWLILSEK